MSAIKNPADVVLGGDGPHKLLEGAPGSAANRQNHWCGQALAII